MCLAPKPLGETAVQRGCLLRLPTKGGRPTLYAGGESETAKNLIAAKCDAYLMHGDPPEVVGKKIADMRERREKLGLGPMTFGVAGYAIVRDSEREADEVERITNVNASREGMRTISNGLRGRSWSRRCRWRITRFRTGG